MSELPGQQEELASLRSKIEEVLADSDPRLRRSLIRELFTREFSGHLSPQFQKVLQNLVNLDTTPANIASENETPEQKVERLLKSVTRAEFDSFQEYSYVSVKSGKGFVSTRNKDEIRRDSGGVYEGYGNYELNREDDIVPYPKELLDRSMRARPTLIPIAVARLIDPALVTESWGQPDTKWGELYCVVGRKEGRIIIQGGGDLNVDLSSRKNSSSFKLVFDSDDAANEYINWLIKDPKDAYGPVLRRAIGSYDEQGNFKQALIPPLISFRSGEKFHDPFSVTPKNVLIKDLRSANPSTNS